MFTHKRAGFLPINGTDVLPLAMMLVAWTACWYSHSAKDAPWLAFRGRPSSRGATGWLLTQEPSMPWSGEVHWQPGGSSIVNDLIQTPEPWFLPTLGPSYAPAVFAVDGDDALVWSRSRGWGWIENIRQRKFRIDTIVREFDVLAEGTAGAAG